MDLSTPSGLVAYLASTPFACSSVTKLSGGYCNATFRVHLLAPYKGRETLVLKHTAHQVIINGTLELPLSRQKYEAEALKLVKTFLPPNVQQIITVPTVHLFDEDAHIIVMDDSASDGDIVMTLKDLLINPSHADLLADNTPLAQKIGENLGRFLAELHHLGQPGSAVDIEYFRGNDMGRKITAAIPFGVLEATLAGKAGLPILDDPPLGVSDEDVAVVRDAAAKRMAEIEGQLGKQVMTHGDFWPGNIMVCLASPKNSTSGKAELRKMHVLDWELAKTCLPALDVGQCCAELDLVGWWYPLSVGAEMAAVVKRKYLEVYGRTVGERGGGEYDEEEMRKQIQLQVGTHFVCWQSRYPWGPKDKVRAIVLEGAAKIVDSVQPK